MTPLRAKMIYELELYRKAPATIEAYVSAVAQLAQHYHRSPDQISVDEVRDFLHQLITGQKVAYSTCNQKVCGLRFFYRQVLGRTDFDLRVPAKRSGRLPEPLSRQEVERLIEAARDGRARVLLMTTYGGGFRVSEVVRLRCRPRWSPVPPAAALRLPPSPPASPDGGPSPASSRSGPVIQSPTGQPDPLSCRSAAKFNWVLSGRLPACPPAVALSMPGADRIKPYTLRPTGAGTLGAGGRGRSRGGRCVAVGRGVV